MRRYLLCLLAGLLSALSAAPARADTIVRIMTANLTSGSGQKYETPGLHLLQGLHPDIVAIQEFNYANNTPADFRAMVDITLGTNFSYFRETNVAYDIPNGIISRFPIVAAGSWDDPVLSNRGFAWARVQLPGTNDLYVVSAHLYAGGTASDRNQEAIAIRNQVQPLIDAGSWVVVAGDFNTSTRDELAMNTFTAFLSDSPVPTDAEAGGNPNTNAGRTAPYDYVLPSLPLSALQVPVALPSHTFPNGLVFDSRIYTPLTDVPPIVFGDSGASGMQHMGVIKDFRISTNGATLVGPSISIPPQSQVATIGSDVTFNVTATGTQPLSYQWLFNNNPINSATNTTYTVSNAQPANAGSYAVTVSNVVTNITSQAALLSFSSPSGGAFARWDFNSPSPDADTTTGTLSPALGAGTATYVGGTIAASPSAFASGSGTDPASGDNSAWNTTSYPAQGTGNKTAGVRFALSTAGRRDIVVRWDHRASSTGTKYARLQYSTNGSAFTDFPVASTVSTSFAANTNDLSSLPGVNNNPNFAFRIVAEFESTAANTTNAAYVGAGGSYGTGGTLRFDMVTVLGNPLAPNPAQLSKPILTAGDLQFSVNGTPGANYIVQSATNIDAPNWISLVTNAAPFTFTDTNFNASPARFYRAVALP